MRKVVLVVMFGAALTAAPVKAFADEEAGCFEALANCYYEAARRDSWISRWLAGLDCELDFVECTRVKIIGT